jgi:hypothetical protein
MPYPWYFKITDKLRPLQHEEAMALGWINTGF